MSFWSDVFGKITTNIFKLKPCMIGVSQTFVSRLLKIEPGEFILVGFPKQFCTEALSSLDSGWGVDVMRVLPGQQPEVEDVDEINKELCSDHSERREQVYSPMEGRHWTRLAEPGTLVQALLATPARENWVR